VGKSTHRHKKKKTKKKDTDLVEDETFRTYPRVSGAVLTVMEHFTVQTFIRVITGLFAAARELGLWQELRETVGFFFFFFQFLSFFLYKQTTIRNTFNCDVNVGTVSDQYNIKIHISIF